MSKSALIFAITTIIVFSLNLGFCQTGNESDIANSPIRNNLQTPTIEKDKAEADSSKARIIGFIFKVLAKAFVSTTDIDKLKEDGIDKISKMDKETFCRRYLDFYQHVYDFRFLTVNYGLDKDTTKDAAIEKIKSLDKLKLYEIIDALPDAIIAREFRKYIYKNRQGIEKSDNIGQLMQSLNDMIESVKRKYFEDKR